MGNIGNENGDFELACCRCGTKADLMQIAHRDSNGIVIGYLFICRYCLPIIAGNYNVVLSPCFDNKD